MHRCDNTAQRNCLVATAFYGSAPTDGRCTNRRISVFSDRPTLSCFAAYIVIAILGIASSTEAFARPGLSGGGNGISNQGGQYSAVSMHSATKEQQRFEEFGGASLLAGLNAGYRLHQRFATGLRRRGAAIGQRSTGGIDAKVAGRFSVLHRSLHASDGAELQDIRLFERNALAGGRREQRNNAWVQARLSHFETEGGDDTGNTAYHFNGEQYSFGMDRHFHRWLFGVAFGGAQGRLEFDDHDASGELDAWFAGLYARWNLPGSGYLRGDLSHGHSDVKQQREVNSMAAEADSTVDTIRASVEAGLDLGVGETGIRPYTQLAFQHLQRDAFRETGGGANALRMQDSSRLIREARMGVDLSRAFTFGGYWARAESGLAVIQPFGDTRSEQEVHMAGSAADFTVQGADLDDSQVAVHFGSEVYLTPSWSLWLGYQSHIGGGTQNHGVLLSAHLSW